MGMALPLGIDSFEKLRDGGYYYVDKTAFIRELLSKQFEASLITRPRRFGKTLTMSMLADFFDISRDSQVRFEGLEISKESKLCSEWQNRWPVIFLTMKSVEGLNFADAYERLQILIAELFRQHDDLSASERVNPADAVDFRLIRDKKAGAMEVTNSLILLTRMMAAHYGRPVILLMDEYDVPLAKASENGYYAEMLDMIRALLGGAIKTNSYLKFAVVTGCLRISKESIFTGTNNFVTDTISGDSFNEYIGFTHTEVKKLLADTGLSDHAEEIRQWYDGYRFGNAAVYCPWDVLNHINALRGDPEKRPKNYWGNTSHNGVIYRFISRQDLKVNDKFETLLSGGSIVTSVEENLTYDTLTSTEKNLWSLLYMTGYLTGSASAARADSAADDQMELRIPNEEVKSIFKSAIMEWFQDSLQSSDRGRLFTALWLGETQAVQEQISDILFRTISYYDYQENFYHAFVAGLFVGAGYQVESNRETGNGRPDVLVKDDINRRALVIEIKHAKSEEEIPGKCQEALEQFERRKYLQGVERGYRTRIGYGFIFFQKECIAVKIKDEPTK